MTHLWPAGELIQVDSDSLAVPQRFTWQGQSHGVRHVAKRWREDQGWWKQRIWREYFKISTDSGLLVIIYRDLVSGNWYIQRWYN